MAAWGWMAALNGLGKAFTAYSDSKARERAATAEGKESQEELRQNAERDYFQAIMAREMEKREAANDAWKRLLQADFVGNYGVTKGQPTGEGTEVPMYGASQSRSVMPLGLTPYSRPIQGPTDKARLAALNPEFQNELISRMNYSYDPYGGQSPTRTPDFSAWDQALKAGGAEKWLGWIGAGLGAASQYNKEYAAAQAAKK